MTRWLVVNADDYGLCQAMNDGILRAHERGIVTSLSIMANGPAWPDARRRLEAAPGLGVGVHLTWVEGRPVSDARRVPSLVDRRGRFWSGWPVFLARYALGRIDLDEVMTEAETQIAQVQAAGVLLDHLDSHEHLHMLPGIFARVVALAQQRHIPFVRWTREPVFDRRGDCARVLGWLRRIALHQAAAVGRAARPAPDGVRFPQACFGLADSGRLTPARLGRLLQAVPSGLSELMCHPATANVAAGCRAGELAALTAPRLRIRLAEAGIQLTTFGARAG